MVNADYNNRERKRKWTSKSKTT